MHSQLVKFQTLYTASLLSQAGMTTGYVIDSISLRVSLQACTRLALLAPDSFLACLPPFLPIFLPIFILQIKNSGTSLVRNNVRIALSSQTAASYDPALQVYSNAYTFAYPINTVYAGPTAIPASSIVAGSTVKFPLSKVVGRQEGKRHPGRSTASKLSITI